MQSRLCCLALLTIILFDSPHISRGCPSVYQMIDKQHSYCADKISVESLPPTAKEIEHILEIHNQERSDLNAKHMQKMYWNTDLAEVAQRFAEHCVFDHDKSSQRQPPRIPLSTGQNLAMGHESWTSAVRAWADEKKDFVYGSHVQSGVVGHYTQMVKDTAALVGCGSAICPASASGKQSTDWPHYVCNYVTGQLSDNKPYTPADSSGSNKKPLYDCHGLVCLYNGSLDLDSCQCQCTSYATGRQCEVLDCSSLSDHCDYGNDKSLCTQYANVPPECPKFCGLCERYEEMKKYYGSMTIPTSTAIGTINYTQSTIFTTDGSISLLFIQIIIVPFVLLWLE